MEDLMKKGAAAVKTEDFAVAIDCYEKAAKLGNMEAWHLLACIYTGYFCNTPKLRNKIRNRAKASEAWQKWYEYEIANGDMSAYWSLGVVFYERADYKKAIEFFEKGASKDNENRARSEEYLGNMYIAGEGVKRDVSRALKWYAKAAEHGNTDAMRRIGELYDGGQLVGQDISKGIQWYQKAALSGDVISMLSLAMMYERGRNVDKDLNKAREWYQKAVNAGSEEAAKQLKKMDAAAETETFPKKILKETPNKSPNMIK